ncbi:MAG TPA: efflux RND transporter periplasmic adaptor subunit, partial [Rhodanobacteraceae bacterium]|nr:efflux RND transporter periplasmic adaptor subunit [Rhodanobacteraceae bacterium]
MPSDPNTSRISTRKLRIAGLVGIVVAIAVVAAGLASRASGNARLREWTDARAIPTVAVVAPTSAGDGGTLDLPGRLEAYSRAPLYARVSGYLKSWKADIGAHVKAGELLAEIEAPDVEQQVLQAKANLATAQANAALSATTAKRWQSMLATGAVSKQDVDEKTGDLAAKQAIVKAAKADLDRLETLNGFTRIVAPFDGVVTARNTDVGALISEGGAAGQELFVVSDTKKLRVYVSVPQTYVPSIPSGTKATITVPERPGRKYEATVESSAQAVNVSSGSTLMQLGVDNASNDLLPGGFANVSLQLPGNAAALRIPSSALLFDKHGLR